MKSDEERTSIENRRVKHEDELAKNAYLDYFCAILVIERARNFLMQKMKNGKEFNHISFIKRGHGARGQRPIDEIWSTPLAIVKRFILVGEKPIDFILERSVVVWSFFTLLDTIA